MIESIARRRIAALGLALLGGCAGPGARGPQTLPGPKPPVVTVTPAPASADGRGAVGRPADCAGSSGDGERAARYPARLPARP